MAPPSVSIPEHVIKASLGVKHECHPSDVVIKALEVSEGSNKGDNYACIMKRTTVTSEIRGKEQHKDSLIVKCMPEGGMWREMIQKCSIFRIEVEMYTTVVPKLNASAKESGLPGITVPTCYYGDSEEGFLVLEDLKQLGYDITGKGDGLDEAHMKLALAQLARLHAHSYHWIEEGYFGGLERFKKDFWPLICDTWLSGDETQEKMMDDFMDGSFDIMSEIVEAHLKDAALVEKVKDFRATRKEIINRVLPPQGDFNVLIHGDAWCNNFMFKHDDTGAPISIQTIDLQLSRRTRPTVDLAYCFGGSTTPEFRARHLDGLLQFYHQELSGILAQLGHEAKYSLEQLKKDFRDCFPFAFQMAAMHAQGQLVDPNKEGNIDSSDMGDTPEDMEAMQRRYQEFQKKEVQTNVKLRERMLGLAREAQKMGVL